MADTEHQPAAPTFRRNPDGGKDSTDGRFTVRPHLRRARRAGADTVRDGHTLTDNATGTTCRYDLVAEAVDWAERTVREEREAAAETLTAWIRPDIRNRPALVEVYALRTRTEGPLGNRVRIGLLGSDPALFDTRVAALLARLGQPDVPEAS